MADTDFWRWAEVREPGLQRLAALLADDLPQGRRWVRDALAVVYAEHDSRPGEDRDARARRVLVDRALADDPGSAKAEDGEPDGEPPVETVLDASADPATVAAVRAALATLTAPERVATVLHHHEGLPESETATLLRRSAVDVTDLVARGEAALAGPAPAPPRVLLAAVADGTPVRPTSRTALLAAAPRRRNARHAVTALASAAALIVLAVPAAALLGGSEPAGPVPSRETRSPQPPPWVFAPAPQGQATLLFEVTCPASSEEYRSATMTQARCDTVERDRADRPEDDGTR